MLFTADLLGKVLFQDLHLLGKRIGAILVVARLDGTIKGFPSSA